MVNVEFCPSRPHFPWTPCAQASCGFPTVASRHMARAHVSFRRARSRARESLYPSLSLATIITITGNYPGHLSANRYVSLPSREWLACASGSIHILWRAIQIFTMRASLTLLSSLAAIKVRAHADKKMYPLGREKMPWFPGNCRCVSRSAASPSTRGNPKTLASDVYCTGVRGGETWFFFFFQTRGQSWRMWRWLICNNYWGMRGLSYVSWLFAVWREARDVSFKLGFCLFG